MEKDLNDEIRIIKEERNKRLVDIFSGEIFLMILQPVRRACCIKKKTKLTRSMLHELSTADLNKIKNDFKAEKEGKVYESIKRLEEERRKADTNIARAFTRNSLANCGAATSCPPA